MHVDLPTKGGEIEGPTPMPQRARHVATIAICAFVLLGFVTIAPTLAVAQLLESAVGGDSEIELVEHAEFGTYQHYRIKITISAGRGTIETNKDGVKNRSEVSSNQSLGLWRNVLKHGLESVTTHSAMAAASQGPVFPDQSRFTVRYRVGQTKGGFSVEGVDSLADNRYRKIVRTILALGDKYAITPGRQRVSAGPGER